MMDSSGFKIIYWIVVTLIIMPSYPKNSDTIASLENSLFIKKVLLSVLKTKFFFHSCSGSLEYQILL